MYSAIQYGPHFLLNSAELGRWPKAHETLFMLDLDRMTYDCGIDDTEATLR